MAIDLTTDHTMFDGLENVTLDGGAVADCLQSFDAVVEAAPSEGGYVARECTWRLPSVPVIAPIVGSVIVDAGGVSWVAQTVKHPRLGTGWVVGCRELDIAAGLTDLIALWPAVVALDEGGGRIVTHPAADLVFIDVPAKIQEQPNTEGIEAGRHQWTRRFHIFCEVELTGLKIGDLIKDDAGNQYTIKSWRNRERIDELSVIVAEY